MKPSKEKQIDDVMKISVTKSIKHRLPWLVIGLAGGILAAHIIGYFKTTLSRNLVLAAFIPLIVYISDAVGTQMESFVIRDFAIHPKRKFIKYFLKHLIITFIIGFILGISLFTYILLTYKSLALSFVLSVALLLSITSSVLTGLILPLIFNKLKLDPANASGPVATILQDIISVTIYLSIASLLL